MGVENCVNCDSAVCGMNFMAVKMFFIHFYVRTTSVRKRKCLKIAPDVKKEKIFIEKYIFSYKI